MLLTIEDEQLNTSLSGMRSEVRKALTLQDAAQRLMERFRSEFAESVVLARTYATLPFRLLPEGDKQFAVSRYGELAEETRVLSLLGTAGTEAAWGHRYGSRDHLCIPLLSEEAVAEMPMVAALIHQLGNSLSWYQSVTQSSSSDAFGMFTESFFVKDASTARDALGRLMIPAQDFVRESGVRSVFGVGGSFIDSGINLVCIIFSREAFNETPSWLLRIPLILATSSRPLVSGENLYSTSENS